jgi:hypothetical protein
MFVDARVRTTSPMDLSSNVVFRRIFFAHRWTASPDGHGIQSSGSTRDAVGRTVSWYQLRITMRGMKSATADTPRECCNDQPRPLAALSDFDTSHSEHGLVIALINPTNAT